MCIPLVKCFPAIGKSKKIVNAKRGAEVASSDVLVMGYLAKILVVKSRADLHGGKKPHMALV